MDLLSAPQETSMVQCSLVVANGIVKEAMHMQNQCSLPCSEPFKFHLLILSTYSHTHTHTQTLDKNLPLASCKPNSTQFMFITVCPM
jgi:hypothetical protein